MNESRLAEAVGRFAGVAARLPDADLERAWAWGEYEEGVRFAFFRAYEELRALAAATAAERGRSDPQTRAQRILAQVHAAQRDLEAVLLGVDEKLMAREPAPEVWSVQQALQHAIRAGVGFYVAVSYGLRQARTDGGEPTVIPDDFWDEAIGIDDEDFREVFEGPVFGLLDFQTRHHARIMAEFTGITDEELEVRAHFWETDPMPIGFRLHRFDSHMRQHTVQIEKTLADLGHRPSEAKRLTRLVYASAAEVEGAAIGAADAHASHTSTADAIDALVAEIRTALEAVPA